MLVVLVVALAVVPPVSAWEETCSPFKEIYSNGKELCETIFGESFVYSTDEDKAYTMWWFGNRNPNKQTAQNLGLTVPDTCQLQYYHKQKPTPEGDDFTECLPWKQEACCTNSTVTNAAAIKKAYGAGYEWDRCGPMSPECERFFVQEACLYECDITAGLYRRCSDDEVAAAGDDSTNPCHQNTWEIKNMPIKASYCDSWYDSCRNDYFCNGGKNPGNFFSCDAFYWEKQEAKALNQTLQQEQLKSELEAAKKAEQEAEATNELLEKELAEATGLSSGAIVAIIVSVVVFFGGVTGFIIWKERQGKPMFGLVPSADEAESYVDAAKDVTTCNTA